MEKLWLFGLFSGDKGDNTDIWMIKITIKANLIDMDVLLMSGLSIVLLVCEFYPHGQTCAKNLKGLICSCLDTETKGKTKFLFFAV